MGTIVRDSIVPYATARKIGWTDVDFLGSAAVYDLVRRRGAGHGRGLLRHGPHRDALRRQRCARRSRRSSSTTRSSYKVDPNIGAVYGYVAADLTVQGLKNAGKDLTLDSFVKGLESIKGYKDIFNGPEVSFGPNMRQGANSSFLAEVKGGRWVRVTEPLSF